MWGLLMQPFVMNILANFFAIWSKVLEETGLAWGYPATHMDIALRYSNSCQMAPPAVHTLWQLDTGFVGLYGISSQTDIGQAIMVFAVTSSPSGL